MRSDTVSPFYSGGNRRSICTVQCDLMIRIDTYRRGNVHSRTRHLRCAQVRIPEQGLGRSQGVGPSRSDRDDILIRLDDLPVSGEKEESFGVAQNQLRFQATQIAVGAPVLGQVYRRLAQVA